MVRILYNIQYACTIYSASSFACAYHYITDPGKTSLAMTRRSGTCDTKSHPLIMSGCADDSGALCTVKQPEHMIVL